MISSIDEFTDYIRNYANRDLPAHNQEYRKTINDLITIDHGSYPRYINEYWTSRQRLSSSIHEISYRACFKAQLPEFFIRLFTRVGDVVYDPFGGRGTTALEAGILERDIISNDINPLSVILSRPRFFIPDTEEIRKRLEEIPTCHDKKVDIDLSMFYHKNTESEILSYRDWFIEKEKKGDLDYIDEWIRMIATSRLTGHSSGFFSVYTLPPNQAVSPEYQRRINEKRGQEPQYRDTKKIILKKTKSLIRDINSKQKRILWKAGENALFLNSDARFTSSILPCSVKLIVTSPPFLNTVQYKKDNWLRCWFNSIDAEDIGEKITATSSIEEWRQVMGEAITEFFRVIQEGGWVAFEVGEVRNGRVRLDEEIIPLGEKAGFECCGVIINMQQFTKTSNIWGVSNNKRGTNTNRIVIFRKS